jgi:hypothetical protein
VNEGEVARLRRYAAGGHEAVEGWLATRSAVMIAGLSLFQRSRGLRGAVGEIGVHHGRLFILLALSAAADETCFAIDVFERQELNVDRSGHGNRNIFIRNLRSHALDPAKMHIVGASSLDVSGKQLRDAIGPARLLSVDGGHSEQCVLNDLCIADDLLADHGVVIMDDVFNQTWPGVVSGYARYLNGDPLLVPFAITPNKVLGARAAFAAPYRAFLRRRFARLYDRSDRFFGFEVDCYGAWAPEPPSIPRAGA